MVVSAVGTIGAGAQTLRCMVLSSQDFRAVSARTSAKVSAGLLTCGSDTPQSIARNSRKNSVCGPFRRLQTQKDQSARTGWR